VIPAVLIIIAASLFTSLYVDSMWSQPAQYNWSWVIWFILVFIGYPMLGLCVGQCCSMFFRSGLLAGLLSVVMTALLAIWSSLMWLWGMNLLWTVVPIPVVLLLATWVRAEDWVLEHRRLRTWVRPGLMLFIPAVVLLTSVPLYRVYQIPAVDPGFSVEEFKRPLTAEEQATHDLYWKAISSVKGLPNPKGDAPKANPLSETNDETAQEKYQPEYTDSTIQKPLTADEIALVKLNHEAIELFVEAGKGTQRVDSLANYERNHLCFSGWIIDDLLIHSAMMLEADGQLDAALDHYLAAMRMAKQITGDYLPWGNRGDRLERRVYGQLPIWAARPKQTSERIKKAIAEIEKITADMPVGEARIEFYYLDTRKELTEGFRNHWPYISTEDYIWQQIPWERARALRMLNVITRKELASLRDAVADIKAGKRICFPSRSELFIQSETAEPPYSLRNKLNIPAIRFNYREGVAFFIWQYADMENRRRATRIVMALQAWKLDRGSLPKQLDELVGPYLNTLPIDPYCTEPYQYYPDGLKTWMPGEGMNFELLSPGKDKPFIWSTSADIEVNDYYKYLLDRYLIYDVNLARRGDKDPFRRATSLFDILSHGRCFFLPD
jgi:hypothetical protein